MDLNISSFLDLQGDPKVLDTFVFGSIFKARNKYYCQINAEI
jgi:hypothetical protein